VAKEKLFRLGGLIGALAIVCAMAGCEIALISSDARAQSISAPFIPDFAFCKTQGAVAIRAASRWQCLTPGTSGYVLTTQGASANPIWSNPSAGGTVTSVGMTVPSFLSVSPASFTTSGTFAVTLATQAQNLVFASPNGSTGAPAFRALVSADLPSSIAISGTSQAAVQYATSYYTMTNASQLTDIASGVFKLNNAAGTAGIGLDLSTDQVAKFRDRTNVAWSAIQAGAVSANGAISATGAISGASASFTAALPVASGGTNCTAASGTCLDNISGLATTGILSRTGAGAYSAATVSATLGSQTANTVFAAPSGSAGNPVFRTLVCSTDLPSGAKCLLDTQTPSGVASVSYGGGAFTGCDSVEVEVRGLVPATANALAQMVLHSNASYPATSYINAGFSYYSNSTSNYIGGATTNISLHTNTLGLSATASQGGLSGTVKIYDPNNTTAWKNIKTLTGAYLNAASYMDTAASAQWQGGTTAIDGWQIAMSAGNLSATSIKTWCNKS
jgi:hypothetical protein